MNDRDENPYSPPSTVPSPRPTTMETPDPSETRPAFRIAAAILSLIAFLAGATSLFPLSGRTAIFSVSMIVFSCQLAYAAITGHWFTIRDKR